MRGTLRWFTILLILLFILLFSIISWGAHLYTDWLWFKSLNYQMVFNTILLSELFLRLLVGLITFIFLFINLMLTRAAVLNAARAFTRSNEDEITIYRSRWKQFVSHKSLAITFFMISIIMAFLVSTAITGDWIILQKFLHPSSFNMADPIFNKDIKFYVFQLPFYQFLYGLSIWLILLTTFWVALSYFISGIITGNHDVSKLFRVPGARYHLSFLIAVLFLLRAWGYNMQKYTLLFSGEGIIFGPGYTDIHANLLAFKVMFFLTLIASIVIFVNAFMRRFRFVLYTIGFLLVSSIILSGIYPVLVQKLVVLPNEMEIEKPYIQNNIKYTRLAYNLDKVEKIPFPAGRVITAGDVQENQDTIKNIRLWDYRPLQQTYGQLQGMRTYYEFKDVDVDRYTINGRYQQVMLSARELNQTFLPENAKSWINEHLKYTHGYGIIMSPVNEVTSDGLPGFLIKDIPPATQTDLKVKQPEIYFGELTDDYVIVNTRSQEFDYPMGDENAWSTYQGSNGVQISSFFHRLLFALTFKDYKLLLSGDINNTSQVLYYRNIYQRIAKIAPFLVNDKDPYIVLDNGKLYWVMDAYTVSDMYPYSEPFKGKLNYIRNSVKIVMDAYTGSLTFYAADPEDPILKSYQNIFPGLFVPLSEMPAGLKDHLRYPEDLFMIQANKYTVYHMDNYQVFYNKEDKWNLPTELFGKEEQPMEPYFSIVRLPGENKPEFIQIMPFTPQKKNNMIAWLASRSDGDNYGKLLVYEFPKQELVYGPMQVEARINQDTLIAQQISLWDQRGSQVIRGNLLVIPVKDALIYVEPLYLQAEQSKMSELSRVIVLHGDRVVMEPTLDAALQKIFEGQKDTKPETTETQTTGDMKTLSELVQKAGKLYDEAQKKIANNDWAGYGNSLKDLKSTLDEMANRVK